ncbi:MAG TPA: hypothetical protein VII99_13585 [Bacteroidia bacterium]
MYAKQILELGHKVSIVCADEEKFRDFIIIEKGLDVTICPLKNHEAESSIFSSRNFYSQYILWKGLKRSLVGIRNIDFVFFMYFDDFIFDFNEKWVRPARINNLIVRSLNKYYLPNFVDRCLPANWSGILFHPRFLKWKNVGCFFISKYNDSICLLDETYDLTFTVKHKYMIPDVTDEQDPNPLSELAATVLIKAKGRRIISLLGSLEKRKGIIPYLDVIQSADADKYFFLLAGKLDITFSKEELDRLENVRRNLENCYCIFDGIPTEVDFNSLVKISDILYLVYIEFFHSSNLLTKASLFRKPVIVAKGYCMGKRVEHYNTGIAIANCNAEEIKYALDNFDSIFNPSKAQYSKYFSLHSETKLKDSLSIILKI